MRCVFTGSTLCLVLTPNGTRLPVFLELSFENPRQYSPTRLVPQPRFGGKLLRISVVCPLDGTAVLNVFVRHGRCGGARTTFGTDDVWVQVKKYPPRAIVSKNRITDACHTIESVKRLSTKRRSWHVATYVIPCSNH